MNILKRPVRYILGHTLFRAEQLAEKARMETEMLRTERARDSVRASRDTAPAVTPFSRLNRAELFQHKADVSREWIRALHQSSVYEQIRQELTEYPPLSFMSSDSRTLLYSLLRATKPEAVAEVGTLFAGTTEVVARALHENRAGIVHTCDPFGADRCPPIIAQWPEELRAHAQFYPLSSMDFFLELQRQHVVLDLVLVDGNHDYEFALFDLQMAARLLRPGGIIVMDNSEQTGPFFAARDFLSSRPGWTELGDSMASFDWPNTFDAQRSSLAATSFVVLKAPKHIHLTQTPLSGGQSAIEESAIRGFRLDLAPGRTSGSLRYQVILRAFRDGNREVVEYKRVGEAAIDVNNTAGETLDIELQPQLISEVHRLKGDCAHTLEIELAWRADSMSGSLQLSAVPHPLTD